MNKLVKGTDISLDDYVKNVKDIQKERKDWLRKPDVDVDKEYDKLVKKGDIQCDDTVDKETKVDRIITLKSFASHGFSFRPVKLTKKILDVMEKDWKFSSENDREVFRMLCLDPTTNKMSITKDKSRVVGKGTAVKPDWMLCEKDFQNKDMISLGGVHTHPHYYDKPLESLGDVMMFATSNNEVFSCTTTAWGTMCMFRKKEPAFMFDIPKVKKGSEPPEPVKKGGSIVYDVKSDVVDWDRVLRLANRNLTDTVFVASKGIVNQKLTTALAGVPWYQPNDESRSVGTKEAPFKFGIEKAEPQFVDNMECETFVDVYGASAKLRTVCNNGDDDNHFYVESHVNPARLFFYPRNGFPTNVWFGNDVDVRKEFPLTKDDSKFWDYVRKDRKGYFETKSEKTEKIIGGTVDKTTVRAAKFKVKGKNYCEYLLLPFPVGDEEKDIGKPGGIFCKKTPSPATEKTCVLT